jgi:hypothetical protein
MDDEIDTGIARNAVITLAAWPGPDSTAIVSVSMQ